MATHPNIRKALDRDEQTLERNRHALWQLRRAHSRQWTLGELMAALSVLDPSLTVGRDLGALTWYEGYMDDLGFLPRALDQKPHTVRTLSAYCAKMLGRKFKGMDHLITKLTPVWIADQPATEFEGLTGLRVENRGGVRTVQPLTEKFTHWKTDG